MTTGRINQIPFEGEMHSECAQTQEHSSLARAFGLQPSPPEGGEGRRPELAKPHGGRPRLPPSEGGVQGPCGTPSVLLMVCFVWAVGPF